MLTVERVGFAQQSKVFLQLGVLIMVLVGVKARRNRLRMGCALIAALLPLVAIPTAQAATVLHLSPLEGMEDYLQGSLCQEPNTCVRIESPNSSPLAPVPGFPNTYPEGVAAIEGAIDETSGEKILFAYSTAARMASQWLAEHADDPDAPSPDELSVVLVGNPTRKYGGSDFNVMPETKYDVIDVSIQYDLTSDYPDNPFNLLAVLNAFAGFSLHIRYVDVDINDPANAAWTEDNTAGGRTTYILVPTENLPLLDPLRALGLTALADALNGPLKEIVEQGYNRPVPFPEPIEPTPTTSATTATALSASAVGDPMVGADAGTRSADLARTPNAEVASTAPVTQRKNADSPDTVVADANTLTTSQPDRADVQDTAKTITRTATQPELNKTTATVPTNRTAATSTSDGNKVEPRKLRESGATTKSGEQATSTKAVEDRGASTKDAQSNANSANGR